MQEAVRVHVCGAEGQNVHRGCPGLFAGSYEHDDRLFGWMLEDGVVAGFSHADDTRGIVCDVESLKKYSDRQWKKI